jgi:cell wall-associated NlpC family hydrolase
VRARSPGHLVHTQRRAWLSQSWRQSPAHLKNPPPKRPALDPIHEALKRRAARYAAPVAAPGTASLTGGLDALLADAANRDLIGEALAARGIRYRWGGASRGGFDCSGFTRYLFARMRGILLPHSASRQAHFGEKVMRDRLQAGDLIFFSTYRRGISHVGIYIGGNRFVHAANRRKDVRVDELTGYYARRYVTARRLGSRVSPPAKLGPGVSGPADAGSSPVEDLGTVHPDEITILKLDPEADTSLAHDGEPVAASRAGPPATGHVEPGS